MATPLPVLEPGTRVFSGARAIYKYNGNPIAFSSGISGTEEIQQEEVFTLGHLGAQEIVPLSYRITFSSQHFRTIARQAGGTEDSPGSVKEQQIFPRFTQILQTEGVDVVIQDEVTGKILYLLEGIKPTNRNWTINARGLATEALNFVGLALKDEAEIGASTA